MTANVIANTLKSIANTISSKLLHHASWLGYWEPIVQWFRPAWRDGYYRASVVSVNALSSNAIQLILQPEKHWPIHTAGQHVALTLEIDGRLVTRVFTIASGATSYREKRKIRLITRIKENGALTPFLGDLKPHDWVNLSAPMGQFVLPENNVPALMVAGGSGITPFIAMLEDYADAQASKNTTPIHLLYYAKTGTHLLIDELSDYQERLPHFSFSALSRQRDGDVETYLTQFTQCHWLACGPANLYEQIEETAKQNDVVLESEHFVACPVAPSLDGETKQQVSLIHNTQKLDIDNQQTLLSQLLRAHIPVTYGCGMGICHQCQCVKKSGVVRDTRTGELSDNGEQLIQLCVTQAVTDLELQA